MESQTFWEDECAKLRANGIPVHTFHVSNRSNVVQNFMQISQKAGEDGICQFLDIANPQGATILCDLLTSRILLSLGADEEEKEKLMSAYRETFPEPGSGGGPVHASSKSEVNAEVQREVSRILLRLGADEEEKEKLMSAYREKFPEPGSGGGPVHASSKSEVNAEVVNAAAAQAVHPVQQLVVSMEHRVDELASYIESHADPVVKSHLEDLNSEAVPVMKKHDDVVGWQDGYMAVRRGTLVYADTYKDALSRVESRAAAAGDEHVIDLRGCSVTKCQAESDKAHFAFRLVSSQVALRADKCALALFEWLCRCCAHACSAASSCSRLLNCGMCRGGSFFGRPASQRSEWPLWRPSAVAPPLLQLLPPPLICKVQATTRAGCCWAPPQTNSRTSF